MGLVIETKKFADTFELEDAALSCIYPLYSFYNYVKLSLQIYQFHVNIEYDYS